MANSFAPEGFNPRMVMGQPVFMVAALALVAVVGFYLYKHVSGSKAAPAPTGQAATPTDHTVAQGTMDQIQQQISVFEQQMASIPTMPYVPVSTNPVPVGVGGHTTT